MKKLVIFTVMMAMVISLITLTSITSISFAYEVYKEYEVTENGTVVIKELAVVEAGEEIEIPKGFFKPPVTLPLIQSMINEYLDGEGYVIPELPNFHKLTLEDIIAEVLKYLDSLPITLEYRCSDDDMGNLLEYAFGSGDCPWLLKNNTDQSIILPLSLFI